MHLFTHLSPHKKKPNKILNRRLVLVVSLWLFVIFFAFIHLGAVHYELLSGSLCSLSMQVQFSLSNYSKCYWGLNPGPCVC